MSGERYNAGKPRLLLLTKEVWEEKLIPQLPRGSQEMVLALVWYAFGEDYVSPKELRGFMSGDTMGCADVLTFGAQKYSAHNWKGGLSITETIESLLRHVDKLHVREETHDEESGLPHQAHIDCNLMFLAHFLADPEKYGKYDDRQEKVGW